MFFLSHITLCRDDSFESYQHQQTSEKPSGPQILTN